MIISNTLSPVAYSEGGGGKTQAEEPGEAPRPVSLRAWSLGMVGSKASADGASAKAARIINKTPNAADGFSTTSRSSALLHSRIDSLAIHILG
jgi:hypothetical protein